VFRSKLPGFRDVGGSGLFHERRPSRRRRRFTTILPMRGRSPSFCEIANATSGHADDRRSLLEHRWNICSPSSRSVGVERDLRRGRDGTICRCADSNAALEPRATTRRASVLYWPAGRDLVMQPRPGVLPRKFCGAALKPAT